MPSNLQRLQLQKPKDQDPSVWLQRVAAFRSHVFENGGGLGTPEHRVERGGTPWSSAVVRLSCKSVERAWTWQVNADTQQSALREASSSRIFLCVLKLRSECSQATQENSCTASLARISCLSQLSSFSGCTLFRIGLAEPHWREAAWCAFSGHPLTFELIHENFHV